MKLEKPLHRLSTEEKEEIIRRIRKTLEKKSEVCFTYLFGSFAKHNLVRGIDVAIWVKRGIEPLEEAIKLSEDLERETRLPVDIVVLNHAPSSAPLQRVQRGKAHTAERRVQKHPRPSIDNGYSGVRRSKRKVPSLIQACEKTRLRLILGDAFGSRSRTQPSTSQAQRSPLAC